MQNTNYAKGKVWATSLLVVMIFLFIIALIFRDHHPVFQLLQAFTEAATVGALADWFAVVALFRYPMGIKFPHTNIIEKKRQQIAQGLGQFVVNSFLTKAIIEDELAKFNIIDRLYHWSRENPQWEAWVKWMSLKLPQLIKDIEEELANNILHEQIKNLLGETQIQSLFRYTLKQVEAHSLHHYLVQKGLKWAKDNQEILFQHIYGKMVEEGNLFEQAFMGLSKKRMEERFYHFLEKLTSSYDEMLGAWVEAQFQELKTHQLDQPEFQQKIQLYLLQFLEQPPVNTYIEKAWTTLAPTLIAYLEREQAQIQKFILSYSSRQLQLWYENQVQRDKINHYFQNTITQWIFEKREKIGQIIETTAQGWTDIGARMEAEVGNDLQYIRINGTLIGGTIGLLLYGIEQLFALWL
ncbi:DUF445 domain-containing protein [Persicobacter diffluens]|uniref:Membrane protein n=1 Tax=Persicobacter diffluens TaxID=981 RepID=A0AAN4VZB7_9BACT|nr:membrane protein [Persicobacter diffluens]